MTIYMCHLVILTLVAFRRICRVFVLTLGLALCSRALIPTDTEAGTCSGIAIIIFSVSFRVIVFLAQVRAVTVDWD